MENLNAKHEVLQQVLLAHYEKDSSKLTDQIAYWELMRRESVLHHYARQMGIGTLGFTVVPTLQVSENRAKSAIKMQLLLQSLLNSPFANEPWSMRDTSIERLDAPPKNLFKKRPVTVEVYFDNNPDNMFPYTSWTDIYYQDAEDNWKKTSGQVDNDGLYYVDDEGEVHYYVQFGVDAPVYGVTGLWRVSYKNKIISTPVSSSSPEVQLGQDFHEPQQWYPRVSVLGFSPASDWADSPTSTTGTTGSQPLHSPISIGSSQSRRGLRGSSRGKRRGRRLSGSPGRQGDSRRGRGGHRQESRWEGSTSPASSSSSLPELSFIGQQRGKGGRGYRGRGRGRGRASGRVPPRLSPHVSIETLGAGLDQPGKRGGGRSEEAEAKVGVPVILLKGPGNALKCWRARAKQRHRDLFGAISTVFSWINKCDCTRIGRHRLVVGFMSEGQREDFLKQVTLPGGVDWSYGTFNSL
ncbi:E2 [Felis catus papillomavirus type 5]|uniref:Regulatory protein E2 n=1 Tax=Felis catus papillomavirus type 5 TaxID=2025339 RepID=A0A223FRD4_9PAPI|nr:E2 [Felis catus papillomavirus type 5]AST11847.1 E2 [Felis catus papillomavirus type 5]